MLLLFIHYLSLISPLWYTCLYMTHATRALQRHDCRETELTLYHIHTFLITQGHGGPSQMSNQPNAGATSETI